MGWFDKVLAKQQTHIDRQRTLVDAMDDLNNGRLRSGWQALRHGRPAAQQVACPGCGTAVVVTQVGIQVRCMSCTQVFVVS
jgi:hypothetical protein